MSPTHSPVCLWQNQPRIKRLILYVILQLLHRYYDQVFHNICGTFESDSMNPVIISKYPTSSLHLKVHLFYYFCYLLMSQIRGSCITFLTTSNLLLLQCLLMEQIVVLMIATGAEILISLVSRSLGQSLGWCYLGMSQRCALAPICCTNSDVLYVEKVWDSMVLDLSRHFFPASPRTWPHHFLTLPVSDFQCLHHVLCLQAQHN